ncbi:MAG: N-methyl-L-tryptophan oxidase [Gemmatimonadaceae bacterium]
MRSYDAIVVGLGAMGSATLFHLARQGKRAIGIEQFEQGHSLGSSHGDSRIIREQYFEHPLYVPLIQRAYELWRDLEEESGQLLMTLDGGLMIGPPDGMVVAGTLRSAKEYKLPHEVLSPSEVHRRFPTFELADHLIAVLDPRAGFLKPEPCTSAHLRGARDRGAATHFDEPVIEWKAEGDGVRVTTTKGEYVADRLLLSGGAWTKELVRDLDLPLMVERQVAFWLEPDESKASYESREFPIYAHEFTPGILCYGFPRMPRGVKASIMHAGELTESPRDVRREVNANEIEPLRASLRPVLPGLAQAPVLETSVCLFTNTPDHHFIIDFHPDHPQVLISSPCSGHGFKFASVVGEVQADLLVSGATRFDISAFRIDRFQ